eukprot:gb/GEZN01007937.1/.p1 GENE.gb/GEZN01007937.1/~~gb/GEZN01007937.1/.p1  ORF type:complete len:383 (-),score=39.53 gb/GEZN01007937.1/:282-1430(-)
MWSVVLLVVAVLFLLGVSAFFLGDAYDRLCCLKRRAREVNSPWEDASPAWTELSKTHGFVFKRAVRNNERALWVVHKVLSRPGRTPDKGITNDPSYRAILFLIHGGGGRAEQWHGVLSALEERILATQPGLEGKLAAVEVVAVELLGHGRSAKPVDPDAYHLLQHVRDVEALMEAHIPKAQARAEAAGQKQLVVAVLGHSVGSAIGIHIAARKKVPLHHLTLLGTGSHEELAKRVWRLPLCLLDKLRPIFARASKALFFHPSTPEEYIQTEARVTDQNPFHVMKYLLRNIGKNWPCQMALDKVTVPTLVLQGEGDLIFQRGAEYAKGIKGCQIVVMPKGGHNFMMRQGDRIVELLLPKLHTAAAAASSASAASTTTSPTPSF